MNKHGGYFEDDRDNIVDFSVNINPFISEKIINTIKQNIGDIIRYPEIDGKTAKKAIARNTGKDETNLILGNGATELIYLYARTVKPKSAVIIQPTFTEYKKSLNLVDTEVFDFLADENNEFKINIEALISMIKRVNAQMIILCNPNNPTGVFSDIESLKNLLDYVKKHNIHVLIDESFIDFTERKSLIDYIEDYPIFIIRSMTKFYAIPGLRLGYGIGSKELIQKLTYQKEPWTLNSFALSIVDCIFKDIKHAKTMKEWIGNERRDMYKELKNIKGIEVVKGEANFHLCKVAGMTANDLKSELLKRKIFIRTCEDFVGLDNKYFRIAVRTREENKKLITCLKDILV